MADNDDFVDGDDNSTEGTETGGRRNPQREYQDRIEKENRKLRDENEATKTQLAKGSEAERELAFIKAGIDTSKGAAKLLLKTYDGELTPEAIKVVAEEYDLVPTSQKEDVKSELDALGAVSQASTGSSGAVSTDILAEIRRPGATVAEIVAAARKAGSTISDEEPGAIFSMF